MVGALLIVAIANAISFLTGLSLSAIATSMNVRGWGQVLSDIADAWAGNWRCDRGAAVSVAGDFGRFYIIGFTESLEGIAFFDRIDPRLLATLIALVFAGVAFIGADFAIKIQYFVLAALMAALLSFFGGGWGAIQAPTLFANYGEGMNFWSVFAVFFPAVTGIAVGASMSGRSEGSGQEHSQGDDFFGPFYGWGLLFGGDLALVAWHSG